MIFQFVLLFLCISDTFFISSIWLNNSLSNICMNIMIAITSYLVILEQVKITTLKDDTKFESNFYISMSFFILNTSVFFFSIIEYKIRSESSSLFYVSYFALLLIQLIHQIYESLRISYPETVLDSLLNVLCLWVSYGIWAGVRLFGWLHWED